jgi:Endonuclease related to archaeal Holliday junction resolvase
MSNTTMLSLVLGVLLTAAIVAVAVLLVKVGRLGRQVAEFPRRERELRSDARKRSRTLHMASIMEQLAPLLPGFRYNPKDVQWIGGHGAVDAIVWNGLEAGGEVEIVFLDVKAGPRAGLTGNQRRIRDAIVWKRIAFDVYRPPETPLLTAAFLSEPSDGEVVSLGEDQADDEFAPADVPELFMRDVIANLEPGS